MSTIVDKVLYIAGIVVGVRNSVIGIRPGSQIKKKLNELRNTKPYVVIVKLRYEDDKTIAEKLIGKCEQEYLSPPNQRNIITIPCSNCQPIDLCTKILKSKQQPLVGIISGQLIPILERTPEEIQVQYAWKPDIWRPDPDLEI